MIFGLILLFSSLCISSISGYFSIVGLTSIFPGSFYPIILMGVVLEIGKLTSVAFLHKYWNNTNIIKYYLSLIIFVLMLINAMGIFGYLSKAHIEQEVSNSSQTELIEIVKNKIDSEKSIITDIDKQLNLIDNALEKLTQTGRASTALSQIQIQRKNKDKLQDDKLKHIEILEKLKQNELQENLNNQKLEADFGPIKYIADFIYLNPTNKNLETVVTWLIIVIIFVFDPLALILLNLCLLVFDLVIQKKYSNAIHMEIDNRKIIGNNE